MNHSQIALNAMVFLQRDAEDGLHYLIFDRSRELRQPELTADCRYRGDRSVS